MSHIKFIIVSIVTAGLLSGCGKFLDESPKSDLQDPGVRANLQEVYRYDVAPLYTHLGGYEDSKSLQGTGRGIYDLNTFTTDEAIMPTRGADWYDGGFWQGLYTHQWGVRNTAVLATWEYLYQVVMLCNRSLERIALYSEAHPDDEIDPYVSEVRALRALFYYHLMDLFGHVPLVLEADPEPGKLVQAKRSELFAFVERELRESAPFLEEAYSQQPGVYYGRITRSVAHFLLAKLILNSEVYLDDDWTDGVRPDGKAHYFMVDGQKLNAWEAVVYYCDRVSAAGYALEPDYETNFAVFNESSKENIFVIPMDKTLYTNQFIYLFRSRHYNHAKAYGLGGENGASATTNVLRTFGYGTDHQDPRFDLCYFAGPVKDLNGNPVFLDDGVTPLVYEPWAIKLDLSGKPEEQTAGARMKKYEVDPTAFKDGKLLDNDIVLFRYADLLLMRSEAKVRNGDNGDADLALVRQRVGAPDRSATLDNLLDERMMELAWEGWRRQDLIRFGRFSASYDERPRVTGEESGFTTVFPIPESILDMNPSMRQNPGYQ